MEGWRFDSGDQQHLTNMVYRVVQHAENTMRTSAPTQEKLAAMMDSRGGRRRPSDSTQEDRYRIYVATKGTMTEISGHP